MTKNLKICSAFSVMVVSVVLAGFVGVTWRRGVGSNEDVGPAAVQVEQPVQTISDSHARDELDPLMMEAEKMLLELRRNLVDHPPVHIEYDIDEQTLRRMGQQI